MENISIDTIYSLLDKFDIFNELLTRYGTALLIAAAVFALLNCFFGYALRKLWSVLLGFLHVPSSPTGAYSVILIFAQIHSFVRMFAHVAGKR